MNNNCIEILGLNYLDIFKNFSLALENEKFINISGANNCGKTTLIRIIDGQLRTKNTILIYGQKQEEYKITELGKIIKTIIPTEITFIQKTVEEELAYQLPKEILKEERQRRIKAIAKKFKLTKFLTETVKNLSEDIIIRLQLAIAVISSPKIILVDDMSPYYTKKELLELTETLKQINKEEKITIIMITSVLDCSLLTDYMYVINEGNIVIEGLPLEVLEKDNILNKAGLNLPFMIDLSVKLRDYDLIKNIELDMDRMVDTLWN